MQEQLGYPCDLEQIAEGVAIPATTIAVKPLNMKETSELEDRRDVLEEPGEAKLSVKNRRLRPSIRLKHDITMCEKCLRCRDPDLLQAPHACAMHFLTRRKGSLEDTLHPRKPSKHDARGC